MGLVGAWLDRDYRISRIDSQVEQQLSEIAEYRLVFFYFGILQSNLCVWYCIILFIFRLSGIAEYRERLLAFGLNIEDVNVVW